MSHRTKVDRQSNYRAAHRRCGAVLFIVMVVVLLASLAGYGFLITMQTENKTAHATARLSQLNTINESGQEFVATWMEADGNARTTQQRLMESDKWYTVLDMNGTSVGSFAIESPSSEWSPFPIESESAKLHLKTIMAIESLQPGYGRATLMRLPGMTIETADAILDWLDEDQERREFGAEAIDYVEAQIPYLPRNGIPRDLEELLLVRGVTTEQLWGESTDKLPPWQGTDALEDADSIWDATESVLPVDLLNQPSGMEPNASPATSDLGAGILPWARFLTTTSAERNLAYDGTPRININDSDLARLSERLRLVLPVEWANFIIAMRQFGPMKDTFVASSRKTYKLDLAQKATYQFQSKWALLDAKCAIRSNPQSGVSKEATKTSNRTVQVVNSPFVTTGGGDAGFVESLLDYLTTNGKARIVGRIDLNNASREVLAAVPGLDEILAENVVSGRETQTGMLWLVTSGLVTREAMDRLNQYVTTRGDVYRFRVKSRLASGRMTRYTEVIWDGSRDLAVPIYRRNLEPTYNTLPSADSENLETTRPASSTTQSESPLSSRL